MSRSFSLFLMLVLASCSSAPTSSVARPTTSSVVVHDPETLRKLMRDLSAAAKTSNEDTVQVAVYRVYQYAMTEKDLAVVEQFAKSDEGKGIAWPLAGLLFDRGNYDAAAG